VGPAAAAYLDTVGLRIMGGYDVADAHAREHPGLLVNIIRTALTQDDVGRRANAEHAIAKVRERVPREHHAAFDELLKDARATYRVRDERIFYGDGLGSGLARRAVLEAGKRLHEQGRIADPTHLVDAKSSEIISLLETGKGPSASELAERVRFRLETPLDVAPARLGFPPAPPPPSDWLPPAAARVARAFETLMGSMFSAKENQEKGRTLKGFSASPGHVEGPARVVMNVGELPLVQAGEILVAKATAPTFNVVLPLVTGIVTERGGALSHAAIVAREYGLPAVVGCIGVTGVVRTGMRVRVDGDRGEVSVLD
jgi:pyruvate,water dikinase